jgi:peptidoglycan-N-acetylglucosamine deacetylase
MPAALYGPPRRWFTPADAAISDTRHIALTLDDGPDSASTPTILATLERHGVHASFFLIGEHVRQHASLVAEMHAAGHEIAIHGWTHRSVLGIRPTDLAAQLQRTSDALADITAVRPTRYRPPYGITSVASRRVARSLNLDLTLWSAWGRDWSRFVSDRSIAWRVQRTLRPGGTVLLHDTDRYATPGSWRRTDAALDHLLSIWDDREFSVGPLREHWPSPKL